MEWDVIYFIADMEIPAVKIGYTAQPVAQRLFQLQAASPHKLALLAAFPGEKSDERKLHAAYAQYRIHREWFRMEGLLAEVVALAEAWPRLPRETIDKISSAVAAFQAGDVAGCCRILEIPSEKCNAD